MILVTRDICSIMHNKVRMRIATGVGGPRIPRVGTPTLAIVNELIVSSPNAEPINKAETICNAGAAG